MKIILIAAVGRDGVIGRSKKPCGCCQGSGWDSDLYASHACNTCGGDSMTGKRGTGFVPCNELPWPPGTYPEDMEHFKAVTMGHAVVMGRLTQESIPARFFPLEGRLNFVVSDFMSRQTMPGIPWCYVPDLESAKYAAERSKRDSLYVIGGARLYTEALPIADELNLTLIDRDYEGDVRFPGRQNFEDMSFLLRSNRLHFQVGSVEQRGKIVEHTFDLAERRQGAAPELTFTRWVRR